MSLAQHIYEKGCKCPDGIPYQGEGYCLVCQELSRVRQQKEPK